MIAAKQLSAADAGTLVRENALATRSTWLEDDVLRWLSGSAPTPIGLGGEGNFPGPDRLKPCRLSGWLFQALRLAEKGWGNRKR
jgi:hypothetical protein